MDNSPFIERSLDSLEAKLSDNMNRIKQQRREAEEEKEWEGEEEAEEEEEETKKQRRERVRNKIKKVEKMQKIVFFPR